MLIAEGLKCSKSEYIQTNPNELLSLHRERIDENGCCYFFEIIGESQQARLVIDLDNKPDMSGKRPNKPLTQSDLYNCIELFNSFLKTRYDISQPIHAVVKVSITDNEYKNNTDTINSAHIIFNCHTETLMLQANIISEFKNYLQDNHIASYLDTAIYTRNRKLRTLGSRKDATRNDSFYALVENNKFLPFNEIDNYGDYVITQINQNAIFIKPHDTPVEPKVKHILNTNQHTTTPNAKYINETEHKSLKRYIKIINMPDKTEWFKLLSTLVANIRNSNIPQQKAQELTNLFLNIKPLPRYNNTQSNDKRLLVNALKNTGIKNSNPNFFIELPHEEIQFIQTVVNPMPALHVIKVKEHRYIIQLAGTNTYYDTKRKILITNGIYDNKKLYKSARSEEHSFFLHNLPARVASEDNDYYPINNFTDWTQLTTEPNKNEYNVAPVGSRKSSLRLNLDITAILQDKTARVLVIVDTVAMALKQEQDILHNALATRSDFKEPAKLITNYKKKGTLTPRVKVYITTYDSLSKLDNSIFTPTHVIIDEATNVFKRTQSIGKETRIEKKVVIDRLKNYLTNCVVKYYDADYNADMIRQLKQFHSKDNMTIYRLLDYEQYNSRVVLQNEKQTIEEIKQLLGQGKKLTISTSYKKHGDKLYTDLHALGKRVLFFQGGAEAKDSHGDINTPPKLIYERFTRQTAHWRNYDIVIWTTTITTGISFDATNVFYKHFTFVGEWGGDQTQETQFIFRTRKLISREIAIVTIKDALLLKENGSHTTKATREHNDNLLVENHNGYNEEYISQNIVVEHTANPEQEYPDMTRTQQCCSILETAELIKDANAVKNKNKLLHILLNCYNWGVRNFTSNVIPLRGDSVEPPAVEEVEVACKEDTQCVAYNYDKDIFVSIKAEKVCGELDEIGERQQHKYYMTKLYNFSNLLINRLFDTDKTSHDKLYEIISDTKEQLKFAGLCRFYRAIQLASVVKQVKPLILKNIDNNLIYEAESSCGDRHTRMYKLYCYSVLAQLCGKLNITESIVVEFLENKGQIIIDKTEDNMQVLGGIFGEHETLYDFLNINYNTNGNKQRHKKALDSYDKIIDMLKKVFSYFHLDITTGRKNTQKAGAKDKQIVINNTNELRVQKYLTAFCSEQQADQFYLLDLYDYTEREYNTKPLLTKLTEHDLQSFCGQYAVYLSPMNREILRTAERERTKQIRSERRVVEIEDIEVVVKDLMEEMILMIS